MKSFASFQRQLNMYGFHRIVSGPDKGGYFHKLFICGQPQLSHLIYRQRLKGNGPRKPDSSIPVPDFYAMCNQSPLKGIGIVAFGSNVDDPAQMLHGMGLAGWQTSHTASHTASRTASYDGIVPGTTIASGYSPGRMGTHDFEDGLNETPNIHGIFDCYHYPDSSICTCQNLVSNSFNSAAAQGPEETDIEPLPLYPFESFDSEN